MACRLFLSQSRQLSVLIRNPTVLPHLYRLNTIIDNNRHLFTVHKIPDTFSMLDTITPIVSIQKRFKKRNKPSKNSPKGKVLDEDEDEEEEDDSDEELTAEDPDSKIVNANTSTMRLDSIGKSCFNIARAKFDEYFYKVCLWFFLF